MNDVGTIICGVRCWQADLPLLSKLKQGHSARINPEWGPSCCLHLVLIGYTADHEICTAIKWLELAKIIAFRQN